MKREILFKGQKIRTKEWVSGGIAIAEDKSVVILTKEKQIVWNVIPETLGQFTGLTDKNGTKIFEGDIIKSEILSKNHWISFGKSEKWGASFCVESSNSIIYLTKTWAETSIVIGNIHENKEFII